MYTQSNHLSAVFVSIKSLALSLISDDITITDFITELNSITFIRSSALNVVVINWALSDSLWIIAIYNDKKTLIAKKIIIVYYTCIQLQLMYSEPYERTQ